MKLNSSDINILYSLYESVNGIVLVNLPAQEELDACWTLLAHNLISRTIVDGNKIGQSIIGYSISEKGVALLRLIESIKHGIDQRS